MEFFVLTSLVLTLGLSSASTVTQLKGEASISPVTCSNNNIACDNSEDNLIDTFGGIKTIEECRQLCYDSNECQHITYYEPNSFPFSEVCFLYRQCGRSHSCSDCVSETRECYRTWVRKFFDKIKENVLEAFMVLGLSPASTASQGSASIVTKRKREVSPVTCASNNTACDASEDNLIDSFGGIKTVTECRQLCFDSTECQYITYFEPNSFPISEVCFLYRQCEETHSCSECVSETRGCYRTCGRNFVGKIDENLLETIPDVETEDSCLELCSQFPGCAYYTYFLEEDPNSRNCFLLSSFVAPFQMCDSCVSGPQQCEGYEDCNLLIDGKQHTFYMFENEDDDGIATFNVHIPHPFANPQCQVRVFVVGGGGVSGDAYDYSKGGGGSGYFNYTTLPLNEPTILKVEVGGAGLASTVSINEFIVFAEPGFDTDSGNGGDGYSGGGALYCDGGENGGDGVSSDGNYTGGHGTGEDITTIHLDNFELTPGNFTCRAGGGGGGILVNDDDGHDDDYYDGKYGYGAGAGACGNGGFSGIVIVEIVDWSPPFN